MPKVFLTLLLSCLSYQALAENEFSFQVPVNIQNIDFQSGSVICRVFNHSSQTGIADVLGSGDTGFTPEVDSFSGTVTVNVSVERPEEANKYKCFIDIRLSNGDQLNGYLNNNSVINSYRESTGRNLNETNTNVSTTANL